MICDPGNQAAEGPSVVELTFQVDSYSACYESLNEPFHFDFGIFAGELFATKLKSCAMQPFFPKL